MFDGLINHLDELKKEFKLDYQANVFGIEVNRGILRRTHWVFWKHVRTAVGTVKPVHPNHHHIFLVAFDLLFGSITDWFDN